MKHTIGIGTPGIIDSTQRVILGGAENIKGWEKLKLADIIEKEFDLPVLLANDANAMALGETLYRSSIIVNLIFTLLRFF
jgi:glucokinase